MQSSPDTVQLVLAVGAVDGHIGVTEPELEPETVVDATVVLVVTVAPVLDVFPEPEPPPPAPPTGPLSPQPARNEQAVASTTPASARVTIVSSPRARESQADRSSANGRQHLSRLFRRPRFCQPLLVNVGLIRLRRA